MFAFLVFVLAVFCLFFLIGLVERSYFSVFIVELIASGPRKLRFMHNVATVIRYIMGNDGESNPAPKAASGLRWDFETYPHKSTGELRLMKDDTCIGTILVNRVGEFDKWKSAELVYVNGIVTDSDADFEMLMENFDNSLALARLAKHEKDVARKQIQRRIDNYLQMASSRKRKN
jgi:hypothetical protein